MLQTENRTRNCENIDGKTTSNKYYLLILIMQTRNRLSDESNGSAVVFAFYHACNVLQKSFCLDTRNSLRRIITLIPHFSLWIKKKQKKNKRRASLRCKLRGHATCAHDSTMQCCKAHIAFLHKQANPDWPLNLPNPRPIDTKVNTADYQWGHWESQASSPDQSRAHEGQYTVLVWLTLYFFKNSFFDRSSRVNVERGDKQIGRWLKICEFGQGFSLRF